MKTIANTEAPAAPEVPAAPEALPGSPPLLPVILGTGFGSGYWPWGPGTAGAVVATAVWLALLSQLSGAMLLTATAALIVAGTLAGTWATRRLMPYWGDDPSRVVIDEMAGVWVALLAATEWKSAVGALLLFRLFDIVKPLGIRALDRRRGAFWVMADDLLAGAYAGAIVLIAGQWATS